jgi:hypothetical protein
MKKFSANHLELRYRTYYAVLYIPKDVQVALGKSKFFETTGTGDFKVAHVELQPNLTQDLHRILTHPI